MAKSKPARKASMPVGYPGEQLVEVIRWFNEHKDKIQAQLDTFESLAKKIDTILGFLQTRGANMPPVGHDTYGYPTMEQARDQFPYALQIITGQSTLDLTGKVKTLHTVASFGLGLAFPHVDPMQAKGIQQSVSALSDADLKTALESSLCTADTRTSGNTGMQAIDWSFWLTLASQVLEFLKRLIPVG